MTTETDTAAPLSSRDKRLARGKAKWQEAKKSKPSIAERARSEPQLCPNCGKAVVKAPGQRGPAPTFCNAECKKAHNNRELAEGRAAIAFLKAWRVDRGAGEIAKESFAEMCRIADHFNAQDRAAGRPRADYYASLKLVDGLRFFDRRRD